MPNDDAMKNAIQAVIKAMMDRVLNNVLVKDPFIAETHHAQKPLYAALVPDEIFKGSHFERRFVTPFGNVWEKLALVAAEHGLGHGEQGFTVAGTVNAERLRRIQHVLDRLEHPEKGEHRVQPNWDEELAYILEGTSDELIPTQVVCDVYAIDRANNKKYAFELKAPMPNSDQTKVSKEKLLKLYSMEPLQIDAAYYALPYNPYGKKENYAWAFPARWFNMRQDTVVLIGDEFWEKIGGTGTYNAFISAVNEIGADYKTRIYKDFLGIEPVSDLNIGKLR